MPDDLAVVARKSDGVAAVGQGGDRRIARLRWPIVDRIGPDQGERRAENPNEAIFGAEVEKIADECNREVAVRQDRDRGRGRSSREAVTEMDLAADLVARGTISLCHDCRAKEVIRAAVVSPDDDVTTIVEGDDLAVGLDFAVIRSVDLRQGFPKHWRRSHSALL